MDEYITYVDFDEQDYTIPITVEYTVRGGYVRATQTDPAEYPEVEVDCFKISKDLAKMLGISEVLDTDRVSAEYLDLDALHTDLLEDWEDKQNDY